MVRAQPANGRGRNRPVVGSASTYYYCKIGSLSVSRSVCLKPKKEQFAKATLHNLIGRLRCAWESEKEARGGENPRICCFILGCFVALRVPSLSRLLEFAKNLAMRDGDFWYHLWWAGVARMFAEK